jgi:hypothetical protein
VTASFQASAPRLLHERDTGVVEQQGTVPSEDPHATAQAAVLAGLREGQSFAQLTSSVGKTAQRNFTPDVAMLSLAVAAMDVAEISRTRSLSATRLRERFLPEVNFKNEARLQVRLTYALYAAAAMRSGVEPELHRRHLLVASRHPLEVGPVGRGDLHPCRR